MHRVLDPLLSAVTAWRPCPPNDGYCRGYDVAMRDFCPWK